MAVHSQSALSLDLTNIPPERKVTVVRVTGIPPSNHAEASSVLRKVIDEQLQTSGQQYPSYRVTIVPACGYRDQSLVGLVDFEYGLPNFLSYLRANPLGAWGVLIDEDDISFDRHFHGFTQLYNTHETQPVTAE